MISIEYTFLSTSILSVLFCTEFVAVWILHALSCYQIEKSEHSILNMYNYFE